MTTEMMIWLIPLFPLLAFFTIIFLTNRSKGLSHSVAVGAAALSWLGSMVVVFRAVTVENLGKHPFASSINWFPVGDKWFSVGVLIDPLAAGTLFFVAWTVLMIFIYSIGYHNFGQPKGDHDRPGLPPEGATEHDAHGHTHKVPSVEPMYSRFFAFIGLFAFGMYLLVVSDNLLTLFVGWEIMGLCSYLLIGFWYAKPSARAAMIKAFITTRVGDVVMLLGIAYLYSATGTLNYRAIFYNPELLDRLATASSGFFGLSVAGLISLLLFVGAVGKSAQWPLHVWLPDAMEGPTPVSAMIHAATMVSAGVYMMIRIFPLLSAGAMFGHSTPTMVIVSFIGTFTAIFAATIAIAHRDIKRVLAYSTISQLGYMIAAIGMGAYIAAAFHLFMHAFFKALLFLGSGSVIHGMEHGVFHTGEHLDPQDMFNMGGLRKKMPITFWTFLIGGLALSGFPVVTAGFWSKDEILAEAFANHHWIILITLSVAALFTAFYTMRQITLTFLGKPRSNAAEHAQESKWTMTLPLIVLAFFALAAGWIGIPKHFPGIGGIIPNFIETLIGKTLIEAPETIQFSYVPLTISLFVSLGGLAIGWWVYKDIKAGAVDPLEKLLGKVYQWMKNNFYFDELYDKVFVQPAYRFSREIVYFWMDRKIIDGFLHWIGKITVEIGKFLRYAIDLPIVNGFGDKVGEFGKNVGYWLRPIQTGRIQQYMVMALVSIAAFGAIFYYVLVFGH